MFAVDTSGVNGMSTSRPAIAGPQAAGPALHQYACLRCRSRRVKCDKILSGCQNCANHQAQCVYSARRPRRPQKVLHDQPTAHRPLLPASSTSPPVDFPNENRAAEHLDTTSEHGSGTSGQSDDDDDDVLPREMRDLAFASRNHASNQDRLLVGPKGNTRYINSDKINQVAYLESVLAADPPGEDENTRRRSSGSQDWNLDASSLLSASSNPRHHLRIYHPPPEIMHLLWEYYVRNVDIMIKVIYKPAVFALVTRASRDLDLVDPSEDPLLLAIWLATITSMSAEECQRIHGEERGPLIRKYRQALEQALAQADWMTTQNMLVLQALSIYLVFASEKSRSTWILNGIALSLAQAMGLHSDSASFSLGAVETEVRRRVWWMLCQTDVRCSENCGLESHVPLNMDTRLPLNINDNDLGLSFEDTLEERNELTEMTLSLGKIELANTNLRFKRSTLPQEEKESIVRDQVRRYESVYLNYYGDSELHRLYYLGTRLMINRLLKLLRDNSPVKDGSDDEEALILYNADVLEIAHQLPCKYRQHGWFFRCKYTQWHAVAYLLIQLCQHTRGPAVDRAWNVIEAVFADWRELYGDNKGTRSQNTVSTLWKPLLRLLDRAREARKNALQCATESTIDTPSTFSTGYEASNMTPSTLSTGFEANHLTPEDIQHSMQLQYHQDDNFQGGLIGDPFFGSADDLNLEMNWEQLDEWVQNFQDGLHQRNMEYQDKDMTGALNWW